MLQGFGVTGYRSFGPIAQYLYPLERTNLIVGRNNVGKSNLLRLVQHFGTFSENPNKFKAIDGIDAHISGRSAPFSWKIPHALNDGSSRALMARLLNDPQARVRYLPLVQAILQEFPGAEKGAAWISIRHDGAWKPEIPDARTILSAITNRNTLHDAQGQWRNLWNEVTNTNGGSFDEHHGPQVLTRLVSLMQPSAESVSLLSAHRQIGAPGSTYQDLNGQGLITRLLELQNPELNSRTGNLAKFAKINNFLSQVLEVENARLDVPYTGKELNVEIGTKVLPIDSLGTGVHEVIIFAAAATSLDNEIVCIEEPEIHLHPRLQRQLLKYLQEQTTNQYFITTHSACLLDASGTAIFHVTLNNHDETVVQRLELPSHRAAAGFDLGYRASDLVQSNAIVWVEGPSDRVYITAWLKSADPSLSEGLHYSIMFYGGRLLSHLTADDVSVSDFISLQRLNRNMAIVIDSDKRRPGDKLNSTKQRVLDEIEKVGGYGWVTEGREIENYVRTSTMKEVLSKVHPQTTFKNVNTKWEVCYESQNSKSFSADKVAIARAAVENVDFEILDLTSKIGGLVDFIKRANR